MASWQVLAHASSAHRHALKEVLMSQPVAARVANACASRESAALQARMHAPIVSYNRRDACGPPNACMRAAGVLHHPRDGRAPRDVRLPPRGVLTYLPTYLPTYLLTSTYLLISRRPRVPRR